MGVFDLGVASCAPMRRRWSIVTAKIATIAEETRIHRSNLRNGPLIHNDHTNIDTCTDNKGVGKGVGLTYPLTDNEAI